MANLSNRIPVFFAAASCLVLSSGCRPSTQPFLGRYLTNSDFVRYWLDVRSDRTFSFWETAHMMGDRGHRGTWQPSSDHCIVLEPLPSPPRCKPNMDTDSPDFICCIDPGACPEPEPFELCQIDNVVVIPGSKRDYRTIYKRLPGSPANLQHLDKMERWDPAVHYYLDGACNRESDSIHCYCAFERDLMALDMQTSTGHLRIDAAEPSKLQHLRGSHIDSLSIYDPSLTSLDDLPPIATLKTLFVQAPLRRLPNFKGFTSLKTLILTRTHLIDFRPLENSKVEKLDVWSFQPVDLRSLVSLASLKSLSVESRRGLDSQARNELLRVRPDIKMTPLQHASWDNWPYLCGLLAPPTMQPCGWMDECQKDGLCSTNAEGKCHAASDADCGQSEACTANGKCSAQKGICIEGNTRPTSGN